MIPASQAIIIAGLRLESARLFQQATSLEFDAQDLAYQASEMENQAEQEIIGHEIGDSCAGCRWYHTKQSIAWSGSCGKHVTIKRCLSMGPCLGIARSDL